MTTAPCTPAKPFPASCREGLPNPAIPRRPVLLLLPLLLAVACGAGPQRAYFTLSYPLAEDRVTESRPPLHPVRLRVKPFGVALPYDRPQMVYRQSPYEFNYDPYRLWASKPQHMLRELVEKHLEAARLVGEVTREYGDQPPDYELAVEVQALEEYDAGDAWFGHLALRLTLTRFKDQSVLWTYEFDRKKRVHQQQTVQIVRALSEVLREEMRRVAADLDRILAQDRGVAATLPMPAPAVDDAVPVRRADPVPQPARAPAPRAPAATAPAPGPAAAAEPLIVPDEEAVP